jgi:hypothetical protein
MQLAGLSVFTALLTLTTVLSHYLEHVYRIARVATNERSSVSPFDLESLLTDWEDTLDDDIRRLVIRGNDLDSLTSRSSSCSAALAVIRRVYHSITILLFKLVFKHKELQKK